MSDHVTPHFAWSEFECRCGCKMPLKVRSRVQALAEALEVLRSWVAHPIRVNSGYRCPAHNKKVGGAPKSSHLNGDAADIEVAGFTGKRLAEIVEELIAAKAIPDGGLGTYADRPGIIHYDLRGKRARW